jgi:hypothetical protein
MLLSPLTVRNPGQRVQTDAHENVARGGFQQFEKLHFRIFQRRVWHVIDERNSDALRSGGIAFDRS